MAGQSYALKSLILPRVRAVRELLYGAFLLVNGSFAFLGGGAFAVGEIFVKKCGETCVKKKLHFLNCMPQKQMFAGALKNGNSEYV